MSPTFALGPDSTAILRQGAPQVRAALDLGPISLEVFTGSFFVRAALQATIAWEATAEGLVLRYMPDEFCDGAEVTVPEDALSMPFHRWRRERGVRLFSEPKRNHITVGTNPLHDEVKLPNGIICDVAISGLIAELNAEHVATRFSCQGDPPAEAGGTPHWSYIAFEPEHGDAGRALIERIRHDGLEAFEDERARSGAFVVRFDPDWLIDFGPDPVGGDPRPVDRSNRGQFEITGLGAEWERR